MDESKAIKYNIVLLELIFLADGLAKPCHDPFKRKSLTSRLKKLINSQDYKDFKELIEKGKKK